MDAINREFIFLWFYFSVLFWQIIRFWIFGMIFGSMVSVFGKDKIHRAFTALQGKKLGVLGVVPASLLGIASPLCMYGTIPIVAAFAKKGMREDWIAAFMMASMLLNPQLLFFSAALGMPILIIRIVCCFLCGVFAGICIRLFFRNKPFLSLTAFGEISCRDTDPNPLLRFIKNLGRNIRATGPFLLAGIILAALFQRYVPQEAFVRLFGSNRGFGILMAATLGVPLYVCGGGTIPLIQTWMNRGMSLGAAASFMIAGPAMKITNLGALKIVLGIKHFFFYIIFAVVFAFFTGLFIDLFI